MTPLRHMRIWEHPKGRLVKQENYAYPCEPFTISQDLTSPRAYHRCICIFVQRPVIRQDDDLPVSHLIKIEEVPIDRWKSIIDNAE